MQVRSAGTTLRAASAASPLGSSTITAQRSRRRSSRTLATRNDVLPCSTVPGTAVFWRRRSAWIVTGPMRVAQQPGAVGRAGDRRARPARAGARRGRAATSPRSIDGTCHSDGSSVDAYTPHLPGRQRVALAARDPPVVEAEAAPGASSCRARRGGSRRRWCADGGGDRLARAPVGGRRGGRRRRTAAGAAGRAARAARTPRARSGRAAGAARRGRGRRRADRSRERYSQRP